MKRQRRNGQHFHVLAANMTWSGADAVPVVASGGSMTLPAPTWAKARQLAVDLVGNGNATWAVITDQQYLPAAFVSRKGDDVVLEHVVEYGVELHSTYQAVERVGASTPQLASIASRYLRGPTSKAEEATFEREVTSRWLSLYKQGRVSVGSISFGLVARPHHFFEEDGEWVEWESSAHDAERGSVMFLCPRPATLYAVSVERSLRGENLAPVSESTFRSVWYSLMGIT